MVSLTLQFKNVNATVSVFNRHPRPQSCQFIEFIVNNFADGFILNFDNICGMGVFFPFLIVVDDYATFPEFRPSKTKSHVLDYHSKLTKHEIFQFGLLFQLDFKLFIFIQFPGPLEEICKMKSLSTEN